MPVAELSRTVLGCSPCTTKKRLKSIYCGHEMYVYFEVADFCQLISLMNKRLFTEFISQVASGYIARNGK
jgi:hypothetical protein